MAISRMKLGAAGFLAGALAGLVMTVVMLLLADTLGVATPIAIFGDRLSVFIPADIFLQLMGRVGGYNHMKQLGVSSVMAGQIVVGAFGGIVYALAARKGFGQERGRSIFSVALFIVLPLVACSVALWPVLGTHYRGLPIREATVVTLGGLLIAFTVFERTLVLAFRGLTRAPATADAGGFTPPIGRRALILGGLGGLVALGGAGLLRKLYRHATFSYDGTQYRGPDIAPITPTSRFYCVTKNVVDPRVDASAWRLEITGLVERPRVYRLADLLALPAVKQETTLMCISNGIGDGLMSNAVWTGVPMRVLLAASAPQAGAAKVRLHGVDNYTDTFPFEKAMDAATLVAFEINGEPLPNRHGFPARAIAPGYFGEKHVKWLTRIEVTGPDAEGFYEKQGWGPDFIVPTRSRFDAPGNNAHFALSAAATGGIKLHGVAFGGDRGIARVEVSFDDERHWTDAKLDYPGTLLTWALWSLDWRPAKEGDYRLVVRATDREGGVQAWDEDRDTKSGITGLHKITVKVVA